MDSSSLHPSELEFAHYLRGSLAQGHAAALFAHTLLCWQCQERLARSFRGTDESAS